MALQPTGVIARLIAAVNAHDTGAVAAAFAPDAYVLDNGREFRGADAIRRWIASDLTGPKVTMEVREIVDHHGDVILRAAYDGDFDRTGLPDDVVLTSYHGLRDDRIVSLLISLAPAAG